MRSPTRPVSWMVELKRRVALLRHHGEACVGSHLACFPGGPCAQVGNFRVEPPGLFRGRGEHPKMGLIKVRQLAGCLCACCTPPTNPPTNPHTETHPAGGRDHQHRGEGRAAAAAAGTQVEKSHPQQVCVLAGRVEGQHQHQGLEVRGPSLLAACCLCHPLTPAAVRPGSDMCSWQPRA
jgi:hypothetical protein